MIVPVILVTHHCNSRKTTTLYTAISIYGQLQVVAKLGVQKLVFFSLSMFERALNQLRLHYLTRLREARQAKLHKKTPQQLCQGALYSGVRDN